MTAGGLALIAGGLATLISFRSLLFGGGESRARRREAIEAPPSRPALAATPAEPEAEVAAEVIAGPRRGRRGRRRALVSADDSRSTPFPAPEPIESSDEDDHGGLASIGLADDDEDGQFDLPEAENEPIPEPPVRGRRGRRSRHPIDEVLFDPGAEVDEVEIAEVAEVPAPRADRYGDRVEGWIRPEHHEPAGEPRPGEYWTPIPVDLTADHEPSAKGYGWPQAVERLPAVPDYEPATGFDLRPVPAEPTEVVPVWPMNDERPGRIRLPRSWSTRNEKPRLPGPEQPAPVDRRRPRPRPRPSISENAEAPPPVDRSTMYVSRHAADPPPR
ncbi:hypothetical protein [Paractinoplanes toevensis]|nr:hypothetical protein [Actinoplanes toevensis]